MNLFVKMLFILLDLKSRNNNISDSSFQDHKHLIYWQCGDHCQAKEEFTMTINEMKVGDSYALSRTVTDIWLTCSQVFQAI